MELKVLETPGHTPEHVSYVVTDRSRGPEPVAVFSGDTLFVGDVGRPDLFPGKADDLASKLYNSLYNKLMKLPDFCEVYPAHGAGSLCGRAMGAKRSSTIGYEKLYNNALKPQGERELKEALLMGMPEAPDHFSRCSSINARGPALVKELPVPQALSPNEVGRSRGQGPLVLDVRAQREWEDGHIQGAVHMPSPDTRSRYREIAPDKPIAVMCNTGHRSSMAGSIFLQHRFEKVYNVAGGMKGWAAAGYTTECPVCSVTHGPRL